VRFWRSRSFGRPSPEENLANVASEVARVLATCRDHMGIEIGRVWLCVRPPGKLGLSEDIARALGREAHLLSAGPGHAVTLPPAEQELFNRFGLTFSGLIANLG
jgi:hypothetical protein